MSNLTPYQCVKSFVHANSIIAVGDTVELTEKQATYLITSGFITQIAKETTEQIKQSKSSPKAKETNHE